MGYGLVNGFIDHVYTPLGTTLYSSLTDQCPQSITVSTSRFLATDLTRRFFIFPRSGPLITAACAELS
jgi:hypothetical protein